MKETIVNINKTKSWFSEKINKIDKLLARLIEEKRIKSTKLEMKKESRKCRNTKDYKRLFSSVQFSHSVVSDSLRPNESQHARPPCPSPTPRVHPNSCASSQ